MTANANTQQPLFRTGQVVLTPSVQSDVADNNSFATLVMGSLRRHVCGDWGDCYPEDASLNDQALKDDSRIFSVYEIPVELTEILGEHRIWIITEWDRSRTTILYPSEY